MKEFFKNEWRLFLRDMQDLGEMISAPFEKEPMLMLDSAKEAKPEKKEGFFARECRLFLEDMQCWGEMILSVFEEQPLMLDSTENKVKEQKVGFFKNEWQLFKQDIGNANKTLGTLFDKNQDLEMEVAAPAFVKDEIDYKLETFLGEPIAELKESACGDKTQHEVLREYASFFKPYTENSEMCQVAFKKYYDRHALKMAVNDFPLEQARIIQNNVDLFIKGQEEFGEGGQFIDSRVDSIFEKVGIDKVNKLVGILSDNAPEGKNTQGERLFAEAVNYMIDNGIKLDKTADIVAPVKKSLEAKLEDVHAALRTHEDWNEEYQALLSQERKYLYALNRIEQYETEQRISEFESKLNELDVIV